MKHIRACPFCGTLPTFKFDIETSMYKLECEFCIKNDMVVSCYGDTCDKVIDNWNKRVSANNTDILNLSNFGYLILNTLEVLDCELFSHGKLLYKKFNLKFNDSDNFDVAKFCFENGIIKVTGEISQMGVDLPYYYTQEQINILIHILSREQEALSFTKFYVYDISTKLASNFTTIKDMLNYLLELKCENKTGETNAK